MATDFARRLFTVEDYHRMAEAGIFAPDDRLELLGGEIVEMTPIGSSHAGCVNALAQVLIATLGPRATVAVQNPVILDDLTEPQPDIAVCHPRSDSYRNAHPRPGEIFLLIEVADTSQHKDRDRKVPRYGKAGIPESWLIDLEADQIEVYRRPGAEGYAERMFARRGEHVSAISFADLTFDVEAILGRR